ncbi:DUF2339 domain-containing protein [uncultured Kriegella sp.]|uniref:DUF2339 domain-containing protein n=1 Tax=uncultured Kriegella sp. TaxID=1798910 RepID=UPI0030D73098|tara:strand:- start:29368 stop:31731 length:2364 start_codon:yes stop_codon:yes gene_type:complete
MTEHQNRIEQLNQKLEVLLTKQEGFAKELMALYKEIEHLKNSDSPSDIATKRVETKSQATKETKRNDPEPAVKNTSFSEGDIKETTIVRHHDASLGKKRMTGKSNLEKFIGENLINKIGIAITVIGVAIGAKYSIDNDLISPLSRIVMGYLTGLGLLGFGIKLKNKYSNYSAVLVSGALAILYFITFAAFSFYQLFPQTMAFLMMLFFTIFGVVAALNYNKPVIAHIGLVGAYAVPFLLSYDSGNPESLFGYMAVINVGILVISLKKYWKSLYFSAFGFTWLIYCSWRVISYEPDEHLKIACIFLFIFFAIFYAQFLAYKFLKSETFLKSDIFLLLLNSFLFYGLGYHLLANQEIGKELLGIFTLGNAVIHFGICAFIFRKKLADRNLFRLVAGLVLVFLTIAVPIQLNGNWVTLLWAFGAALLFWIGTSKNTLFYRFLSYPLMILGFISLLDDWSFYYGIYDSELHAASLMNIQFLSSMLFVATLAFMIWIDRTTNTLTKDLKRGFFHKTMSFALPLFFLLALYGSFYTEIDYYLEKLYQDSKISLYEGSNTYFEFNYSLIDFKNIFLINYTLLFLSLLALVNRYKIRERILGIITMTLQLGAVIVFLTVALYTLSELRESYLNKGSSDYFEITFWHIGVRYLSLAFFTFLLVTTHRLVLAPFMKINFGKPFEILLHAATLWIASSELLNWMDLSGSDQSYKLGLSILWGAYALFVIGLGIWKRRKYLRISGIVLFAITLLKLFLYDIASLNTISKTIVFVALGVLLLVISFLYNKYKPAIHEDEN